MEAQQCWPRENVCVRALQSFLTSPIQCCDLLCPFAWDFSLGLISATLSLDVYVLLASVILNINIMFICVNIINNHIKISVCKIV